MKTGTEVGPAKPSIATPLQCRQLALRLERSHVEQGVRVNFGAKDLIRRRSPRGIERHEQILTCGERLELVHPVGHLDIRIGFTAPAKVIPA